MIMNIFSPYGQDTTQQSLDKTLIWGIVFSLIWIWGIGSLIAFVCGIKARKAIIASNGNCQGTIRVWWCLLVGGFGVLWSVTFITVSLWRVIYPFWTSLLF